MGVVKSVATILKGIAIAIVYLFFQLHIQGLLANI